MYKKQIIIILSACLLLFISQPSFSATTYDSALKWHSVYSQKFIVHYHTGIDASVAEKLASYAENFSPRIEQFFNWKPQGKVHIILNDRVDLANGWASPLPRNTMSLYITPPSDLNELTDYDSWLEFVFRHEYVHIVHLDKANGTPLGLRNLFGRIPAVFIIPVFPNIFTPNWMTEGIATWLETDHERGIGRGQATMFEAMFKNELRHGFKPLTEVSQNVTRWPGNTSWYLYGVFFFQFMHETYGTEKTREFFERYSRFPLPFFMNSIAYQSWRKNFYRLWNEFEAWGREKYLSDETDATAPTQALTHKGFYSGQPRVMEDARVLYTRADQHANPALMLYNPENKRHRKLLDIRGSRFEQMRFDYSPEHGVVINQHVPSKNTNLFSDLYLYDLKKSRFKRLTRKGRYLMAAWIPGTAELLAVYNKGGKHALHRMDKKGNKLTTIWDGDEQTLISSIDVNQKGDVVAAIFRPGLGWHLARAKLENLQWQPLSSNDLIESSLQFTQDGKRIIYAAEYNKTFNIYTLDINNKQVQQLTQVNSAAIYPALDEQNNRLYFSRLDKNGFNLHSTALRATPSTLPTAPGKLAAMTKALAAIPATPTAQRSYQPVRYLSPTWWTLHLNINEERNVIGAETSVGDPLGFHSLNILGGYDTDNEVPEYGLNYRWDHYWPAVDIGYGRYNDLYLFTNGPVAGINKVEYAHATVELPWLSRKSFTRLYAGLLNTRSSAAYRSTLLGSTISTPRMTLAIGGFSFSNTAQYSRTSGRVDGIRLNIDADHILEDTASGSYLGNSILNELDIYSPPLAGQVLRLRGIYARSDTTAEPYRLAFSPETGLAASNRKRISLRGYSLSSGLTGNQAALLSSEWRTLLGTLNQGIMLPPVALSRVHAKLFMDSGIVWKSGWTPTSTGSLSRSAGAELLFESNIAYRVPVDITLGYVYTFDSGGTPQGYAALRIGL